MAASLPKIFDLLKEEVQGTAKESLEALCIIPLVEIPVLVLRVNYLKRHIQALLEIERLEKSFSNPSWDGNTVAFARYATEGTFIPTVFVDTKWWNIHDIELVSEAKAEQVTYTR